MLLLEYNTKNLPLSSCPASANGNHVFSQPRSEFWLGWHFLQSSYEVQNATKRGRSRLKSYFCANESLGSWICQGQAIWDLSFKLCNVQAMSLLSRNFLFPTLLIIDWFIIKRDILPNHLIFVIGNSSRAKRLTPFQLRSWYTLPLLCSFFTQCRCSNHDLIGK